MKLASKQPSPVDIELGAEIRKARLSKRLSQEAMAGAIGVTFQQVQKYEKGRNRISVGRLYEIAGALEVPVVDLLPKETKRRRVAA